MKMVITELIVLQAKAVAVMFCAGIAVETLWQLKKCAKGRLYGEFAFWIIAGIVLCKFLYYASFGRLSLYAAVGFFAGLFLWKKICCVIMKDKD